MRKLLMARLLAATGTAAQAQAMADPSAGCLTEDGLSKWTQALMDEDERQMAALYGTECFLVSGLDYSIVDRGFLASEVRVYLPDGSSAKVFVSSGHMLGD